MAVRKQELTPTMVINQSGRPASGGNGQRGMAGIKICYLKGKTAGWARLSRCSVMCDFSGGARSAAMLVATAPLTFLITAR